MIYFTDENNLVSSVESQMLMRDGLACPDEYEPYWDRCLKVVRTIFIYSLIRSVFMGGGGRGRGLI